MSKPEISIVMPAYRHAEFMREAVESVLAQTYKNFELIIVIDGPDPDTREIADSCAAEDERIKIVQLEKNGGVANARNTGVKRAEGEYIAFLDNDDKWLPRKLEMQIEHIKQTDASLSCTAQRYMDESGAQAKNTCNIPTTITRKRMLRGGVIFLSTVMAKKEALLKYPMERGDLHEDYICWIKFLTTETAAGLNEPLTLYRINKSSKNGNKLKTATVFWRSLRYLKLPFPRACLTFICYAIQGVLRFGTIKW